MSQETRSVAPAGADYLPAEIFRVAKDLRTAIDRELAGQGLTAQQGAVMLVARLADGATPGRLAVVMGTDSASITRLADRLEAKGLIVRTSSPRDRREVRLGLTERATALVPDLVQAFRNVQERLVDGIPPAELAAFRRTLDRLQQNVESIAGESGAA